MRARSLPANRGGRARARSATDPARGIPRHPRLHRGRTGRRGPCRARGRGARALRRRGRRSPTPPATGTTTTPTSPPPGSRRQAGRLQAVIQPRAAVWEPAHDESDAAGFALLYTAGGADCATCAPWRRAAPARFDHGTWTARRRLRQRRRRRPARRRRGRRRVTIDVPAIAPGTVLARPFVLTYDGGTGADLHWVDRAPGGDDARRRRSSAPTTSSARAAAAWPARPARAAAPATDHGGRSSTRPARVVGGGSAHGRRPRRARRGPASRVALTATARAAGRAPRAVTQADGSFSLLLPIGETTRRARRRGGDRLADAHDHRRLDGPHPRAPAGAAARPRPRAPSTRAARPRAAAPPRRRRAHRHREAPATGASRFRLAPPARGPLPGRLHPVRRRAERSTSNTGVIR